MLLPFPPGLSSIDILGLLLFAQVMYVEVLRPATITAPIDPHSLPDQLTSFPSSKIYHYDFWEWI